MQIAARQSFLTGRARPILPYDADVEYIQSDGTQYVDTGYAPNDNAVIEYDFQPLAHVVDTLEFGIWGNTSTHGRLCWYCATMERSQYGFGGGAGIVNVNNKDFTLAANVLLNRHLCVCTRASLTVDGVVVVSGLSSSLATNAAHFWIGKANDINNRTTNATRVFGCTIYVSSALLQDFIPVRVGSGTSARGYLYDRVSGALFGNAADGGNGFPASCVGPDKTT